MMKKPELQDFGIEPEEYALYKDDAVGYLPISQDSVWWAILGTIFSLFGNDQDSIFWRTIPVVFLVVFSVFGIITQDVGLAIFFGILQWSERSGPDPLSGALYSCLRCRVS